MASRRANKSVPRNSRPPHGKVAPQRRASVAARRGKLTSRSSSRISLGRNNYGKSRVRMLKVFRDGNRHTVKEVSVDIALEGDFESVHARGDNSLCLPTDTMKNTVYALGRRHRLDTVESFASDLARHFFRGDAPVSNAKVRVSQVTWERAVVRGKPHPHCFLRSGEEVAACEAMADASGLSVSSGIDHLVILKSRDSAFSGFLKDRYTTLRETRDRIMATSLSAWWEYQRGWPVSIDFRLIRETVRRALIETFADHHSESVQHTLHAMGTAVLRTCPHVSRIRLSMPNKHCLLVDLSPFGLTNRNEVFVPTEEPHGLIEASLQREVP